MVVVSVFITGAAGYGWKKVESYLDGASADKELLVKQQQWIRKYAESGYYIPTVVGRQVFVKYQDIMRCPFVEFYYNEVWLATEDGEPLRPVTTNKKIYTFKIPANGKSRGWDDYSTTTYTGQPFLIGENVEPGIYTLIIYERIPTVSGDMEIDRTTEPFEIK